MIHLWPANGVGVLSRNIPGCPQSQWIEHSEDLEKHISSTCPLSFLIIYASDASAIALPPDNHHGQPRIGRDPVPKLSPKASIVYFSSTLSLWSEYQGPQLGTIVNVVQVEEAEMLIYF